MAKKKRSKQSKQAFQIESPLEFEKRIDSVEISVDFSSNDDRSNEIDLDIELGSFSFSYN